MRNFKIFLWIFVIFLVQTVVLSPIHIFGAVPSAVLAFVMCVAILENEFRTAVIISGICAVVMGAIGGRNFTEITLFYAYSSIIVFAARKRPRYVGNFPKTIVWTFIMSAILEILLFVIREMTLDVSVIFSDALPTAVFNTVIAVILYPILKKTLYKEEKKKKKRFAQRQLKGFPQDMRLRRAPAGGKYTRREGPCFKFPYTLPHRTAKRHFQ